MNGERLSPYAIKVRATDERIWKTRSPMIGRLDIELTERCNNNCIHCCINLAEDDAAKQREMSTEMVKRVLLETAALGTLTIRFTGGEPLLREDFCELYLFARRLGLKVLIFTNARLITPEIADLLARVPPLKKVEITVYGMTRKSYEAVSRVKGSYDEFRRGVDLLIDRKVRFVVKGAILPPNRGEIGMFEEWAMTLPEKEKPSSYSLLFNLRSRRDMPSKNRVIKRLRLSPEESVAFVSRDREQYLREMREFCPKFMHPSGDNLFSCGAGNGGCVDAYGILQPCMMLRHPDTVYDLRSGSFNDALTHFFPKLLKMKATNPEYLGRCARCFLKSLCEQCPAKSWMEYGTLDTPVEYYCTVAHAHALDLGLIREGERAWEIEDWKERIMAFEKE